MARPGTTACKWAIGASRLHATRTIRVANGGVTETAVSNGTMLDLGDMWSPIVIQTGRAQDYPSFAAFQSSVMSNPWQYANGKLSYTSEAGTQFEIWSQSTTQPKVDGADIELDPSLSYDSPYLHGVHGEDKVTLAFPGMDSVTLDFAIERALAARGRFLL